MKGREGVRGRVRGRKGECEGQSVREEGRVRGRKGGWEGEGEREEGRV